MDRRNFFKIVSTVSAGAATTACGTKSNALIPLLVRDREIVPGEEQWHPAVCTECGAGCGVIARVMEGERVVERNGEKFRERIACVKKLEGNPLDPVSGGRLCARGHAALQSLYNPDRITGPMRRTGARGQAAFTAISWDDAIAQAAEKLKEARSGDPRKILFLTAPRASARTLAIRRFLEAIGAPPPLSCSVAGLAVERKAADAVFGWKGIPRYDLAQARYALGVGADFLGGWASPVYYGRQFGHFRQGRPGIRGKLVQAESRMSVTAGSADEWLPVRPGCEAQFLVAIARLLLDEKLAHNPEGLPEAIRNSIEGANLPDLIRRAGINEKQVRRVARELGESDAPVVIAGASVVHSNSLDAAIAGHYVNVLLGNVGKPGGLLPPSSAALPSPDNGNVAQALAGADVLLLNGENPVYSLPDASEVNAVLARLKAIVSFGVFVDDTAAYADVILPDHHSLESEAAVVPEGSGAALSVTIAEPFVQPLYNTRPVEQTLGQIAKKMNVTFMPVSARSVVEPVLPPDHTWDDAVRQGGIWREDRVAGVNSEVRGEKLELSDAVLDGAPEQFPLQFQPYPSLQYHDGSGANLPWMQELPDPASSSMWDLPVEIDPSTAKRLNVSTGDWVRLESSHGRLEAPAYVHPAAIPGVVSMAIGEGHVHYGRYASGKGTNPLGIVAPVWEKSTGALAFGATRVRMTRLEARPRELVQFSPNDREQGPWGNR